MPGLADLARRVNRLFGGPQDVEWAFGDGRVCVLQSRPITAVAERAPTGPVLGPGPAADTFPEPLRRLEAEAWLEPLRHGIVRALRATGAISARRLAASPVAVTVGGWPTVDLELLGVHRAPGRVLNPLVGGRRLLAAWRVGRMRAGLPALAADLAAQVDDDLAEIPPLARLGDAELVTVIANARTELASVHAHEILAGMLLASEDGCTSAPALALAGLARAPGRRAKRRRRDRRRSGRAHPAPAALPGHDGAPPRRCRRPGSRRGPPAQRLGTPGPAAGPGAVAAGARRPGDG